MAFIAKQQAHVQEILFKSDVIAPTAAAISDVNRSLNDRKLTLVRKKLSLLDKRYMEFLNGGDPPELFVSELYELNEESQHIGAP